MHQNPRFCFVGWHEIEQHEAGDTIHHSFNLHPILGYWQLWFYTIGYIGGELSNSTSPIMHYPAGWGNAKMWREQRGYDNSGVAVSYEHPRAMTFDSEMGDILFGVRVYCYGLDPKYRFTLAIYQTNVLGAPRGDPVRWTNFCHVPYKRQWPDKGFLYLPVKPLAFYASWKFAIVIYGDPRYPADNVFWWSRWAQPPDNPGDLAWRGLKQDGWWLWIKDLVSIYQYQLWEKTPDEPPCAVLPDNITP